jgi:hypothetical protein
VASCFSKSFSKKGASVKRSVKRQYKIDTIGHTYVYKLPLDLARFTVLYCFSGSVYTFPAVKRSVKCGKELFCENKKSEKKD